MDKNAGPQADHLLLCHLPSTFRHPLSISDLTRYFEASNHTDVRSTCKLLALLASFVQVDTAHVQNVREMAHLLCFRARIPKATSNYFKFISSSALRQTSFSSPAKSFHMPASGNHHTLSQHHAMVTAVPRQKHYNLSANSMETTIVIAALAGHLASHIRYATAGWKDSFNAWCRLETT